MSRTYRHEHNSQLFGNGNRGHHNTLLREFKDISRSHGGGPIKDFRGLIAERDYQSDRLGAWRRIADKKRRQALKRKANKMIEDELNDE